MEECISTLTRLDVILAGLRQELSDLTRNSEGTPTSDKINAAEGRRSKQPDYTTMERDLDIAKARRLISAREGAIKSVKSVIEKRTMVGAK